MTASRLFRVSFQNSGQIYEIYARKVSHGELLGFVEIEELVFGEKTTLVVDPSEEKLKLEFAGVKRSFLPIHAIVRIDEVAKEGPARIVGTGESGKVMPFPLFTTTSGGDHKK